MPLSLMSPLEGSSSVKQAPAFASELLFSIDGGDLAGSELKLSPFVDLRPTFRTGSLNLGCSVDRGLSAVHG